MFNHEKYGNIPERTLDGLDRWAKDGLPPGSFGKAVLSNNLKDACARADHENALALHHIIKYCWNELPSLCWGSKNAYEEWPDHLKEKSNEN